MGFFQRTSETYGQRTSYLLKLWSSNKTRLASFVNRRIFLIECKRQDLIPSHIGNGMKNVNNLFDFNSSLKLNRKVAEFNNKLAYRIIRLEIDHTILKIKRLEKLQNDILEELNTLLPQEVLTEFYRRQNIRFNREFHRIKQKNRDKICRLQKQKKDKYVTQDKWFRNLTSMTIPDEVKTMLSLGSKFSIATNTREISVNRLVADIENILDRTPTERKDLLRAKATSIVTNHLQRFKYQTNILDLMYNRSKNFLRTNNDLRVLNSDKGSVTVIMTKEDYLEKMNNLLTSDSFRQITRDPTQTIQSKSNKIVTELEKQGNIDNIQGKLLRRYNSVAPRIYGNPKLHKPDIPLRPIVSDIQGPTSSLALYMARILTNAYDRNNDYYVKDTFEFAESVNNLELRPNYTVVSLDVKNLFGNLTKELVFEAVKRKWNIIENYCNITEEKFVGILKFLLESGYFVFEGKFYMQVLGCTMGSRLSPILSLYVMDYLLDSCIPKLPFKVPFIKKFVDDIVTAIPETDHDTTLRIFNSFDENLQFTIEIEDEKQSVPFLDTKVCRINNIIKLDWYTKASSSDRYIHYLSDHTTQVKINFIKEKVNRIKRICHPEFVSKNIKKLKNILVENSYPIGMVNRLLFSSNNNSVRSEPDAARNERNSEDEINIKYCTIPNIKILSTKLKECFKNEENIRVTTKNQKTIASLYSKLKDPVPDKLKSNVVYKVDCKNCSQTYVGQTSQWLKNRIALHRSDIRLNNQRCALSIHANSRNHEVDLDNVEILDVNNNYKKRTVLEMIRITEQPIPMNKKTDTQNLSNIYTYLLSLNRQGIYDGPVDE